MGFEQTILTSTSTLANPNAHRRISNLSSNSQKLAGLCDLTVCQRSYPQECEWALHLDLSPFSMSWISMYVRVPRSWLARMGSLPFDHDTG